MGLRNWAVRAGLRGPAEIAPAFVALDVDGTLLEFNGSLSRSVADAVRRTVAAGAHVVVATGRSMHATMPVCDALGLSYGFAVCSNGAVTVDVATRTPIEM